MAEILIVDDDPADRVIHRRYLDAHRDEFSSIHECSNAHEAMAYLQTATPDCCLLDFQLPEEDGLAFLKRIRGNGLQHLPVVAITGRGDEKTAVEMLRHGAQEYLIKDEINSLSLYRAIQHAIKTCQLQYKIERLAFYDSLTGLLNRQAFIQRLRTEVRQALRYHCTCALIFLDLDYFKQVNDTYGHSAGDTLLKTVGQRIQDSCRRSDCAARLGGDEFVVLLSHADSATGHYVAQKLLQQIERPIDIGEHTLQVTPSIGIAHFPSTANSAEVLLTQADQALYEAKRRGRAQYVKFSTQHKHRWHRHQTLTQALPKALAGGELGLLFEPVVDTGSGRIERFEARAHWPHADFPLHSAELMELTESLNLTDPFYDWLFETAFQQVSHWRSTHGQAVAIGIDLPSKQWGQPGILARLQQALERHRLAPGQVQMEMAEASLLHQLESAETLLKNLCGSNLGVALDDFGNTHSCLHLLAELPIDTLKIDRRFFLDWDSNPRRARVVDGIAKLAHNLGLKVVAQGIDTQALWQSVCALGCDSAQGRWLGEAQPGRADYQDFLRQFEGAESLFSGGVYD